MTYHMMEIAGTRRRDEGSSFARGAMELTGRRRTD